MVCSILKDVLTVGISLNQLTYPGVVVPSSTNTIDSGQTNMLVSYVWSRGAAYV